MNCKNWHVCVLAAFCALVLFCPVQAREDKPIDEGKAEEFKGKTYDVKEKTKVALTMTFPAGKEATITVKGEKKTDVHLFVFDAAGKEVAKDDSPGPDCEVKITPKEAGKLTLEIRNLGPGDTRTALKVAVAK